MIFQKYFRQNNWRKKLAFLMKNKAKLPMQKFDHNIVFLRKTPKLTKIAENCNHNIAPRSGGLFVGYVSKGFV
jgi:hypothetical protein